jgi:hypothetical protein
MESHGPVSGDANSESAEGQEEQGGHFDREGGGQSSVVEDSDAVPTPTDIDEELEDRGDV